MGGGQVLGVGGCGGGVVLHNMLDSNSTIPCSSGALPVKNTFIHFDSECLSPVRRPSAAAAHHLPVEPYKHPRGSLTLSPGLPRRSAPPDSPRSECQDVGWDALSDSAQSRDLESSSDHHSNFISDEAVPKTPERTSNRQVSPGPSERVAAPWPNLTPDPVPMWRGRSDSAAAMTDEKEASMKFSSYMFSTTTSTMPALGPMPETISSVASLAGTPPVKSQRLVNWPHGQSEWMPLSSFGGGELDGFMFRFTLRRADNVRLGLEVQRIKADRALLVVKVNKGLAMDAWNKQCELGPGYWKAVQPGDRIVQANGKLGCASMLEEIQHKQLLQLLVVREVPAAGQNVPFWPDQQVSWSQSMATTQGFPTTAGGNCYQPVTAAQRSSPNQMVAPRPIGLQALLRDHFGL